MRYKLKHPKKTFIGRIGWWVDFLGDWFSPQGLAVVGKTVDRMAEKVLQFYEQGEDEGRIGAYLRHWVRWVQAGGDIFFWIGLAIWRVSGWCVTAAPNAPYEIGDRTTISESERQASALP